MLLCQKYGYFNQEIDLAKLPDTISEINDYNFDNSKYL